MIEGTPTYHLNVQVVDQVGGARRYVSRLVLVGADVNLLVNYWTTTS